MPFAIDVGTDNFQAKTPAALVIELLALTQLKRDAIWADMITVVGGIPRWADVDLPLSFHVAPISLTAVDQIGSPNTNQLNKARMMLTAFYMYGKPHYLKNPSFDPTINVIPYIP